MTGKSELEEDGSNLALVLNRLLKDVEARRKLLNLVGDILPFVCEIDTQPLADRSIFFTIAEIWSLEKMPANLLSNGTVAILAIVVAIYWGFRGMSISIPN